MCCCSLFNVAGWCSLLFLMLIIDHSPLYCPSVASSYCKIYCVFYDIFTWCTCCDTQFCIVLVYCARKCTHTEREIREYGETELKWWAIIGDGAAKTFAQNEPNERACGLIGNVNGVNGKWVLMRNYECCHCASGTRNSCLFIMLFLLYVCKNSKYDLFIIYLFFTMHVMYCTMYAYGLGHTFICLLMFMSW